MNRRDALAAVGAGAAWAALGAALARGSAAQRARPAGAGSVRLWAADRARHRVVALDGRALVAFEVEVPAPVALASAPDGGVWIASALEGGPRGARALLRVDTTGRVVDRRAAGEVRGLASLGAQLYGCEGAGAERAAGIVRWPSGAGAAAQDLVACEARGIACGSGGLWWVDGQGRVGHVSSSGTRAELLAAPFPTRAHPLAIAAAPRGGAFAAWSCVDHGGAGTWLGALDLDHTSRSPVLRWLRKLDGFADACLAVDGRGGVWAAAASGAQRFNRWGTRFAASGPLPTEAVDGAATQPDGGLWLAAGGALMRLDGRGRPLPGQGRFGWLVDLCPALTPAHPARAAPRMRR